MDCLMKRKEKLETSLAFVEFGLLAFRFFSFCVLFISPFPFLVFMFLYFPFSSVPSLWPSFYFTFLLFPDKSWRNGGKRHPCSLHSAIYSQTYSCGNALTCSFLAAPLNLRQNMSLQTTNPKA